MFKTILIICALSISALSVQWFEEGDPHFLTGDKFNETINDSSHCKFIKFFTPWCRYCRVLKEIIDAHKVTTYLNSTDVRFYEVNCHQSPDICMPLKVYSVPMIMIVNHKGETKQTATGVYPKQWYVQVISNDCQIPKPGSVKQETKQVETPKHQNPKDAQIKPTSQHNKQASPKNSHQQHQNTQQNNVTKNSQNVQSSQIKQPSKSDQQNSHKPQIHKQLKKQQIPVPSPQHLEAEADEEIIMEQSLKRPSQSQMTNQEEQSPIKQTPKGQSFRSFLLLAFAFAVCFFLHSKFCSQNRNRQPI